MLTKKTNFTQKISDINPANLGRSQRYWIQRGYKNRLSTFRKPLLDIHKVVDVANLESSIIKKFNIRGLEFGNWLNAEDRYNYVLATVMAFYDLNKILSFNYNLGLDQHLILSFGARGKGRALAHFEPWSNVINITRYDKDTTASTKSLAFQASGGVGALAHEYGHYLDYFFGSYVDQSRIKKSLSGGDYSGTDFSENYRKDSLRGLMSNLLYAIIYKKPGTFSDYYKKLKITTKNEYYFRHNELFARMFEQYISYKLANVGVINRFLAQMKYEKGVYMGNGDLMRVVPLMDKLIKHMAQLAKVK